MNNPLKSQSAYIKKIKDKTEKTEKQICDIEIVCFPNVYTGGTDSELMIENMKIKQGDTVLDLCTGNGIIALAASKKGAKEVIGTDLNPEAIKNANENKKKLKINNVKFVEGDLFTGLSKKFDVIIINPPYTNKNAVDLTEICFWDKDNSVIKQFFRDFDRYLEPNGKTYFAWADFADQDLLKALSIKYNRKIKLLSSRVGRTGYRFDIYSVK